MPLIKTLAKSNEITHACMHTHTHTHTQWSHALCNMLTLHTTDADAMHVGHVLCIQYGFVAADILPLHFSFFLQQVLLDRNTTNTKRRPRTSLNLDACLVFLAPSAMEKWSPQTRETRKQRNLQCGFPVWSFSRNGWHGSATNNNLIFHCMLF